ncbi:MAG: gliding motility-associated C-terminal domain-containing protein, partial [Bacteroidia bacterium]|nr:gliding motility-associated C-terminal domain-containing protein [Bacteroidia bacterium]
TVSPGSIRFINWDLGNGQSSTNNVVKAYYNISGFYTVKLTTTTDSGCIDSYSNIVRVYPKPAAWFNVNDSAQCLFQNNYIFDDVSYDSVGVNLYKWNINNEVLQTTKQAQYKFLTPGFKNINLISTSLRGCSDTIDRIVYVKPMPDPAFEKLKDFYCELTGPINFSTITPGGTFIGKNIVSNVYFPIKLWTDTITYEITVNGCTDSSKQKTEVYPGPKVDLGADTTMCKYEILELTINSWQSQYVWDNGSNNVTRKITKPGIYAVTVTNICGVKSDTIEVKYRDINCRFFLPLAFTPNGDGMNDRYTPLAYNLEEMDYSIYNRWGAEIYRGKLGDNGWDGNYMEAFAPSGTYIISVRYMYDLGYRQVRETASASFELLR